MLAGMVAGTTDEYGYVRIIIKGKTYRAHRLAWLWVHGVWPEHELDHRDLVRSHNWLSNLREATHDKNMMNKKKYKNNKSGFMGVWLEPSSGRYIAQHSTGGKVKRISRFPTADAAHAAYQAAIVYRGEFRPIST